MGTTKLPSQRKEVSCYKLRYSGCLVSDSVVSNLLNEFVTAIWHEWDCSEDVRNVLGHSWLSALEQRNGQGATTNALAIGPANAGSLPENTLPEKINIRCVDRRLEANGVSTLAADGRCLKYGNMYNRIYWTKERHKSSLIRILFEIHPASLTDPNIKYWSVPIDCPLDNFLATKVLIFTNHQGFNTVTRTPRFCK